ncbi:MAG: ribosome recycling factor [Methylococcales bacterium]|nr:ribosome recycling factor [Methylococcales bacterium]MBT7443859.1 ribosome recycling factor [Methylococcales bacterium]
MIDEILEDAETRMQKSVDSMKIEMTKVRTGRAHPSLLDHIKVDYYGSDVPLSQVANVNAEDARTLSVTPWEKQLVPVIEKAIMKSNLGLTPNTAGTVIRLPMPALTEERRKDLVKVVRAEAEGGRVSIRNIRRDANGDLKTLVKEKMAAEDEEHKAAENVQKLTDKYVANIDKLLAEKEEDLLKI